MHQRRAKNISPATRKNGNFPGLKMKSWGGHDTKSSLNAMTIPRF